MTALLGSEKQVKWAEDLRTTRIAELGQFLADAEERAEEAKLTGQERRIERAGFRVTRTREAIRIAQTVPWSGWWIKQRDVSIEQFLDNCKLPSYVGFATSLKLDGSIPSVIDHVRTIWPEYNGE